MITGTIPSEVGMLTSLTVMCVQCRGPACCSPSMPVEWRLLAGPQLARGVLTAGPAARAVGDACV